MTPLLASIRLALDLCTNTRQLAGWWDWPPHREARWHLDDAEREAATAAYRERLAALLG